MKICHLNYYAKTGGAAIAARRLHSDLLTRNVNSSFLAVETEGDSSVIGIANGFERRKMRLFQALGWRVYRLAKSINYSGHGYNLFPTGLVNRILRQNADILHIHSLAGEMLSIREIERLCRCSKHVVWTFHDSWAYTGTEQYYIPETIPRYRDGYLKSNNDNLGVDIDRFFWNLKMKHLHKAPFHIVSPSRYLAEQISESPLFSQHNITIIPHGLNSNSFAPMPRDIACQKLGINSQQRYIGVAAVDFNNRVKGGDIVKKIAKKFSSYTILMIGNHPDLADWENIISLGKLDSEKMPLFYSALDCFLNPTRLESFGLTNLEAMMCGVPVLSTNSTAINEVVPHLKAGYLAKINDLEDYIKGFNYICQNREKLSLYARNVAISTFNEECSIDRYLQLYNSLLDSKKVEEKCE